MKRCHCCVRVGPASRLDTVINCIPGHPWVRSWNDLTRELNWELVCLAFDCPLTVRVPYAPLLVMFVYDRRIESQHVIFGILLFLAATPGLPIIGNLLQLKEKKPHKTFTKWAETYGAIYSIRTGAHTMVVLNSTEVAKEVINNLSVIKIYIFHYVA